MQRATEPVQRFLLPSTSRISGALTRLTSRQTLLPNEHACGPVDQKQRHRLDQMVERVVIKVSGMDRYARMLDRGRNERQNNTADTNQQIAHASARVHDYEGDEQKHGGGDIVNDRYPKRPARKQYK